jgi:hypothetical protein
MVHMTSEQQVAQRFMVFLVENIVGKAAQIAKATEVETVHLVAAEMQTHCTELQNAIETLFSEEGTPKTARGRKAKNE